MYGEEKNGVEALGTSVTFLKIFLGGSRKNGDQFVS